MRARKHKLTVSFISLIILLAAVLACPAFADDWQLYTAPNGAFKMMVPGRVTVTTQDLGQNVNAQNYTADGDTTKVCLIACELQNDQQIFDKFAEGAKGGITKKGARITQTRDVSGPGWNGLLYDYSKAGESDCAMLVAKVDDSGVYYTIAVNSASGANEGKSLFSSFEVDPRKVTSPGDAFVKKWGKGGGSKESTETATSTGDTTAADGSSTKNSDAYKEGRKIGERLGIVILVVIGFLVLTVPIGIIIALVYVIKQRDKRSR
jgi:hypothetical protein